MIPDPSLLCCPLRGLGPKVPGGPGLLMGNGEIPVHVVVFPGPRGREVFSRPVPSPPSMVLLRDTVRPRPVLHLLCVGEPLGVQSLPSADVALPHPTPAGVSVDGEHRATDRVTEPTPVRPESPVSEQVQTIDNPRVTSPGLRW